MHTNAAPNARDDLTATLKHIRVPFFKKKATDGILIVERRETGYWMSFHSPVVFLQIQMGCQRSWNHLFWSSIMGMYFEQRKINKLARKDQSRKCTEEIGQFE